MTTIDRDVLAQIDALQCRYIAALDSKNMDAWLNTFSNDPDASYICTTAENVEADLPLGLILDDCHARLEDRVTFVTKIWAGTYSEYRTRHFVQRTDCRAAVDGNFDVESQFMILHTPSDTRRSEVFACGVYIDRIRIEPGGAAFLSKKVITDADAVQRYVVFPF